MIRIPIILFKMICCYTFLSVFVLKLTFHNSIASGDVDYGVDVSTPIHHLKFPDKNSHFAKRYKDLMEGCYKWASKSACDSTERARVAMNMAQPASQINYTDIGFKKMKVPQGIWKEILKFWETNKGKEIPEDWPPGNTYVNNWDNVTTMVSFENKVHTDKFQVFLLKYLASISL